jgi:hypothetical protein
MNTNQQVNFLGDNTMKFAKTTIAAVLLGLSVNAFAAVSDISNITHGSQAGQEQQIGQITTPRWSDRNAMNPAAREELKPFAKAAGTYSFGDISAVTHN